MVQTSTISLHIQRNNNNISILIFYTVTTLVPTLTEVYRDKEGNVVHLMNASPSIMVTKCHLKTVPDIKSLFWKGCNGKTAKINIMKKCSDLIYEVLDTMN